MLSSRTGWNAARPAARRRSFDEKQPSDGRPLGECSAQDCEAFRDRLLGRGVAFHFKRHIALEAGVPQDLAMRG